MTTVHFPHSSTIMKTSSSINEFHKWLQAKSGRSDCACSILLHDNGAVVDEDLVEKIAGYLNEYDEEGEGRWLAATNSLVRTIAEDAFLRQLVGLEYDMPRELAESPVSRSLTFDALSRRGYVIGCPPTSDAIDPSAARFFQVGVGDMEPRLCHMVLNPEKISDQHMAPIIGDVFLEWLHGRHAPGIPA